MEEKQNLFRQLRQRYRRYLLGEERMGKGAAACLAGLEKRAETAWKSLVADEEVLFSDLDLCPERDYLGSFQQNPDYEHTFALSEAANRLSWIALAAATPGSRFYQDAVVMERLVRGLDQYTELYFTGSFEAVSGGNWYAWVIAVPTAIQSICIVLYDQLPAEKRRRYAGVSAHYVRNCMARGPYSNDPVMTGGNLLMKANCTLQAGILLEEEELLSNVREGVRRVLVCNRGESLYEGDADGFYQDGSYIQHQALAYIGGYGADLYRNLGVFLYVLQGSCYAVSYPDKRERLAFDTVFRGIIPFFYKTRFLDLVSGRDVTRAGDRDRLRASVILDALLPLRGTFPTEEENHRFDGLAKYYLSLQPDFYFANMTGMLSVQIAEDLLADEKISIQSNLPLTRIFSMDKAVHLREDFGLAISMNSDRTYGHEEINREGKRTWNVSDGMIYLYDMDDSLYDEGFWATVDPTRLPGTTAEHLDLGEGTGDRTKNIHPWCGGAVLPDRGAAAVGSHFCTLSRADRYEGPGDPPWNRRVRSGSDVKKSWFVFGDQILALGAGITSHTGNRVETIVENRKIAPDAHNRLAVNGKQVQLPVFRVMDGAVSPNSGTVMQVDYLTIEGERDSRVGYYFPGGARVNLLKEIRTGDWNDQGREHGTETAAYAEVLLDHGTNPKDASYAYLMIPGADDGRMKTCAAAPDIQVLQNDKTAAAARDERTGILAVNFWQEGSAGGLFSEGPASVLLQTDGDKLMMAAADPTQQQAVLTITLPVKAELLSDEAGIRTDENNGKTTVILSVKELEGSTRTAVLRRK